MMPMRYQADIRFLGGWLLAVLALAHCDTVVPEADPLLVVEAFVETGHPPPAIRLRHTVPLAGAYTPGDGDAVDDAEMILRLEDTTVVYQPLPASPGLYAPSSAVGVPVAAETAFVLQVAWGGQRASAFGEMPPPITLDSVAVDVPDRPVEAVLLDSLILGIDSLNVQVNAQKGFIYPITVTLWWDANTAAEADESYWVQTQLKPFSTFSSAVVDFFLLPEQLLQENQIDPDLLGRRSWTGVYAVPVERAVDPVPPHTLQVSVLRSNRDYARYATSRNAPQRREPLDNVTGGIGIVAGISIDSLHVQIE